ncbi:MAG: polyribonucleotide nucleotidyltransferase [Deltaproteobacteria bacterium]|nr:MAG: polyribonucleotide nucleotidyltransferase [Deltaproteobacteria bacterium]
MEKRYVVPVDGKEIIIETGRLAKQAGGSVVVRMGDSVVLVTACVSEKPREGVDFLPLVVDYQEKTFAAGRIPGGFFKREGRPSEHEILVSRLIDRPIRPLFPDNFFYDTQIIATVLSMDYDNPPEALAIVGASCALTLSEAPFQGPIAAVRVSRKDGKFVVNPPISVIEESDLDIIVAGSRGGVTMVEGEAAEVPEEEVLDAILYGWEALQPLIDVQEQMLHEIGKKTVDFDIPTLDDETREKIDSMARAKLEEAFLIPDKLARRERVAEIWEEVRDSFSEEEILEKGVVIASAFKELEKEVVRKRILEQGLRIDGRRPEDIRPIWCEAGVLPRTHGSAIFTRGETQVLVTTTLGTAEDEQIIDDFSGETSKRFMLHYNFPPYSVGEVRMLRAPARREIGHGALAERAVERLLPPEEEFPYTIRVVSEVLESNGSSSMATVCGASLSLMDAGVPLKAAVGGIAMGLIIEGDRAVILSDILGDEDHLGDMDFKVAGTRKGVTAIQMDIKVERVQREVLQRALVQAREGRLHILDKMDEVLDKPRPELSPYAPRFEVVEVKPEKIRDIIGPGGKTIRGIIEKTGVKIDIEENGIVRIYSPDKNAVEEAVKIVKELTREAELGRSYVGKVKRITDFGAFVEIFPGTEGLLHISQISHQRIRSVSDILKEGDEVLVKVIEIDSDGKIRLSRKELIKDDRPPERPRHHSRRPAPRGKPTPRK